MTRSEFEAHWATADAAERERLRIHAQRDGQLASWIRWEERLDGAARSLRRTPRADALESFLAASRQQRRRIRRVRFAVAGLAVAAGLVVAIRLMPPVDAPPIRPTETTHVAGLLSDAGFEAAEQRQRTLDAEHGALRSGAPAPTPITPTGEAIRHLDAAIVELRGALAHNPKHEHLRDRLEQLTERRNRLLAAWTAEVGG